MWLYLYRYKRLGVSDERLSCLLLEHAAIRNQFGLRADAARLVGQALALATHQVHNMGLKEMKVRQASHDTPLGKCPVDWDINERMQAHHVICHHCQAHGSCIMFMANKTCSSSPGCCAFAPQHANWAHTLSVMRV